MNLTVTSDHPYEVRVRFRRSSSDPYWDRLYKHTAYKVFIDNPDDTWGTYINDSRIFAVLVNRVSA